MAGELSQVEARNMLNAAANGDRNALRRILNAIIEGEFVPGSDSTPAGRTIGNMDLRRKSFLFDDFLAAGIDARLSSTAGGGTGNAAAATVAGAQNGEVTLKTSSVDAANSANFSMITFDQLNYKASQGGLFFEARVKLDNITQSAIFIGFSDVISTTVEQPVGLAAGAVVSDATDAAGVIFDVDGTNKTWAAAGVKNNVDTVARYSGIAPVANVYDIIGVEIDKSGAMRGYLNDTPIGDWIANAITPTVALTPCIALGNRAAAQITATLDYLAASANR